MAKRTSTGRTNKTIRGKTKKQSGIRASGRARTAVAATGRGRHSSRMTKRGSTTARTARSQARKSGSRTTGKKTTQSGTTKRKSSRAAGTIAGRARDERTGRRPAGQLSEQEKRRLAASGRATGRGRSAGPRRSQQRSDQARAQNSQTLAPDAADLPSEEAIGVETTAPQRSQEENTGVENSQDKDSSGQTV